MMEKRERLLLAIGNIDEKYIKESEIKMRRANIIRAAVILGVIVALGLYLFLPYAPVTSDLSAYRGSEYYPLIEGIEDYRLSFLQPEYDNNFDSLMGAVGSLGNMMSPPNMDMGGSAPDMNDAPAPEYGPEGNGSYVESTDNQVEGVIESDLMKMTDKYIFRLAWRSDVNYRTNILRVYSVAKEDSALVAEFEIPRFENEYFKDYHDGEMFLSQDGNTVTIIKNYTDEKTNMSKLGIISLDVSEVENISVKASVSIDGSLNTSRMVDGRLLLVTEFVFNRSKVDYNNPTTFVPSIDSGNGAEPIRFEDIVFPDTVGNTRYSVVALLDAEDLSLLGANALLNFTNDVYISENHVYVTREYVAKNEGIYEQKDVVRTMTDIAVVSYSAEGLESRGVITAWGYAEDQYSFDEKDGYLRLVTTTNWTEDEYSDPASISNARNVSLWIFDLADNSLAYSLRNFAIPGEEATAVRFRGDMVYVCTAVVVTFTDPVYFIDLSDYENISSADTGVIEGYSDHLIDLGDGFLLGIGREDWEYSKIEVYEQQGNEVVSIDKYLFIGDYSTEYKSYLVNREHNLFGFGVNYYYYYDEETGRYESGDRYILIHFNGYEIAETVIDLDSLGLGMSNSTVRAAYIDGYLYITTQWGFTAVAVE